jgi:hypothetical protein
MIVWVAAVLMQSAAVGHAQDSQTAAEIVANGTEISLADCRAEGATRRDWVVIPDTTARSGTAIEHMRATTTEAPDALAEEIVRVDANVAADVWHTLVVRAQDDCFTVYLDDDWIFTGYDKTFPHAGRIALWADPGSITRFDRITMGPVAKSLLWR